MDNSTAWKRIRAFILKRDNYTCAYCGSRANTVDHIIPRAKWPANTPGLDDPTNLVAACVQCNSRKQDKMQRPPLHSPGTRRQW